MGSAFWLRWRRCKLMPFWDSPILIPSVGHPDMTSLYLSRYVYIYIHVCIYIYTYVYIYMGFSNMPIWRRIHRNFHILSTPGWLCMCMCIYIYMFIYLLNYLFIHVFIFLFILISCDIYILHRNPTLTGIISPLFCCVHLSTSQSLQTQTEAENSTAAPAPFRWDANGTIMGW